MIDTRFLLAWTLLVGLCGACSKSSDSDSTYDTSKYVAECNEYVDAIVGTGVRCGLDAKEVETAYTTSLGFSCAEVFGIRYEDDFYAECLPNLRQLACDDVLKDPPPFPCGDEFEFAPRDSQK